MPLTDSIPSTVRRTAIQLAVAISLAVFAVFVWPTRYRDFRLQGGPRSNLGARQDRFTGVVSVLTPAGWQKLDSLRNSAPPVRYSPDNPFAGKGGPR